MRSTDTKQTHYSMLLICEGTHTEPNFLALMIEDFKETGIIDFVPRSNLNRPYPQAMMF